MQTSSERILTTHVGSLIRPPALQDIMRRKQARHSYDQAAYERCLKESVAEVVRRQGEVGIDVVSDFANFTTALARAKAVEGFLPVVAPASALPERRDEYYSHEDDWMNALTAAMRTEYTTIVDAGLLLQIDDARAAVSYDRMVPPGSLQDYRRWLGKFIESL